MGEVISWEQCQHVIEMVAARCQLGAEYNPLLQWLAPLMTMQSMTAVISGDGNLGIAIAAYALGVCAGVTIEREGLYQPWADTNFTPFEKALRDGGGQ